VALLIAASGALSACGGGGDEAGDNAGTSVSGIDASGTEPTVTDTSTSADTSASADSTTPPTSDATTTTVAAVESPLAQIGVASIEWTGPSAAAGDRPTLSWEPVPDAVEYRVVVASAASGRPVWAWQGTETTVPLGAGLIDGQEGPRLTEPSVVDVFAIGADGTIVAASGPQPVSP
jgi:hypothetical protein